MCRRVRGIAYFSSRRAPNLNRDFLNTRHFSTCSVPTKKNLQPRPPQPPHNAQRGYFALRSAPMAERAGATVRRRERLLRAWHRHEQLLVAMELATALHHSAQRPKTVVEEPREVEEHETNDTLQRQKEPPPGARPGPERSDRSRRHSSADTHPTPMARSRPRKFTLAQVQLLLLHPSSPLTSGSLLIGIFSFLGLTVDTVHASVLDAFGIFHTFSKCSRTSDTEDGRFSPHRTWYGLLESVLSDVPPLVRHRKWCGLLKGGCYFKVQLLVTALKVVRASERSTLRVYKAGVLQASCDTKLIRLQCIRHRKWYGQLDGANVEQQGFLGRCSSSSCTVCVSFMIALSVSWL